MYTYVHLGRKVRLLCRLRFRYFMITRTKQVPRSSLVVPTRRLVPSPFVHSSGPSTTEDPVHHEPSVVLGLTQNKIHECLEYPRKIRSNIFMVWLQKILLLKLKTYRFSFTPSSFWSNLLYRYPCYRT